MLNYKFKTEPYAHQLKALEMSWNKEVFAYFMEMGTGKSKVLIDNISMLYDKGKINAALIIAPKGVYKNWYDSEIPNHMVKHINKEVVLWQALINKTQQFKLNTLFKAGIDLRILIMNVEAFSTKKGLEFAKKFLNCSSALVAIDESTTIKNPGAKRTKAILSLSKMAKYRRILTGSPVTKSPLDLYTQCFFLDPFLLDHQSYYSFRTRYALMRTANFGGRSVQIVVGYRNLGELSEKLKPFSYRVLKDDCLDLPKKTFMKRIVQLSPDQLKVYDQMRKTALATLNGKMTTTATALTQIMRLQQITCGHFKADDGTMQDIPNNRIKELVDILYEIEGKVVIWAHWQRDVNLIIKEIVKEFGEGCCVDYYGLTLKKKDKKILENFKKMKKLDFLLEHPKQVDMELH